MKKTTLFLVLAIGLFLAGCAEETEKPAQPEDNADPASESPLTEDIEGSIEEIDELEKELNTEELDNIDQELEEIDW